MIQPPIDSFCAALHYETGKKFFHRAVPELDVIENHKISVQPRGIFHTCVYVIEYLMNYYYEWRSKERRARYEAPSF
jgi:hypothetical protein